MFASIAFSRILLLVATLFFALVIGDVVPGRYSVKVQAPCENNCRLTLRQALRDLPDGGNCKIPNKSRFKIGDLIFLFPNCGPNGPAFSAVKQTLLDPDTLPIAGVVLKVRRVRTDSFSPLNPSFRRRLRRRRRRCRRTGNCPPGTSPEPTPSPSPQPTSNPTPNPDFLSWGVDEVDGSVDGARCPATSALGAGVDIYIMDTGCEPDMGALCLNFVDGAGGTPDCADDNNHGSHVSGIATSEEFGVATEATRHCVKVLDATNSGLDSEVAQGIAAAANHAATTGRKSIINLSLRTFGDSMMDDVIAAITSPDIFVIAAVGNDRFEDNCNTSPARTTVGNDNVFAVLAHDIAGNTAVFNNQGDCSDISAPGVAIISDSKDPMEDLILSGTSQATPHVSGALAVLLSDGEASNIENLSGSRVIGGRPALEISC